MTGTAAEPRMLTVGEHLEELRAHVIRGLVAVFVLTGAALFFQDALMAVVTAPHKEVSRALEERRQAALDAAVAGRDDRLRALGQSVEDMARLLDEARAAARSEDPGAAAPARDEAALRALGERYDRAALAVERTRPPPPPSARLSTLTYPEAFFAYLKIALLAGILGGLPYLLWEMWRFVAEGLHEHEQRWIRVFAPLTLVCMLLGILFSYFVLIPVSLRYLVTYGSAELFEPQITLSGYIDLFFGLSLAMGVIFELPLVLILLRLIGVMTAARLRASRRYFLLIATVIAAFVTPTGDPWTLALVTAPLLALYEIGILAVAAVERRMAARPPDGHGDDDGDGALAPPAPTS